VATGTRGLDPATVRDIAERLRALAPEIAGHPGLVVVSFDLYPLEPLLLWDAFPEREASYWKSPAGTESAAIGRVAAVPAGPRTAVEVSADALYRLDRRLTMLDAGTGGADREPVRLYGGTAFDGGAAAGVWAEFGSGEFVLPEISLESARGRVRCRIALDARPDGVPGGSDERLELRFASLVQGLGRARTASPHRPVPEDPSAPAQEDMPDEWLQLVQRARAAIRERGLRKVVVCRRRAVPLDTPRDPAAVLRDLSGRSGEYVFGARRGDRTFLGASPELLMRRTGNRLRTEALAGTRRLDAGLPRSEALAEAAEQLYASGKDLEEHALVVQGIVEALAPLVERRSLPEWPEVHGLTGLAHLRSRIEAELTAGVNSFELLRALHPTPAVGGLPRSEALDFLSRSEPVERGWYAGPIGWVNTAGDAEIAVGIRSALLAPHTAWLYAGAGIVLASDPLAEFRETDAKMRRLSSALRVTEIPA
jgi:isochorismate synthase